MNKKAYSILHVKSVDDEQRVIEGIATTPEIDRVGDSVDPLGITFALPLPLLLFHDSTKPVGQVFFAKPTSKGIPFKASLPKVTTPGIVKDRIDEAWDSLKHGLIGAVSIGFRVLNDAVERMANGGYRFLQTEWIELSLCVIPANPSARITGIKSIDTQLRAAVRPQRRGAVKLIAPGAVKLITAPPGRGGIKLISDHVRRPAGASVLAQAGPGRWAPSMPEFDPADVKSSHSSKLGEKVFSVHKNGVETLWLERKGLRMIEGIASTPAVNSHGYSLNSAGCKFEFPIPLLSKHGFVGDTRNAPYKPEQIKIGDVVWVQKSASAIRVRAIVDETLAGDHVWQLIESGEVRAFSAAATDDSFQCSAVVEGNRYFDRWKLLEVSVCRSGACPGATFEIFRP